MTISKIGYFNLAKYAATEDQILALTAPQYTDNDWLTIELDFEKFTAKENVTVEELQAFAESGAGEVLAMTCDAIRNAAYRKQE